MSVVGGAVDEFADDLPEDEMIAEQTFANDEMIDEEYAEEGIGEAGPASDEETADEGMGQVPSDLEPFDEGAAADLSLDQEYADEDTEEPIGGAAAFKVGSGGQWWED